MLILVTPVDTLSAENVGGGQREAPSCAICRASLSVDAPMIPNFSVDNAIEKHVQALRTNGIEGWENDGSKFTEWEARKVKWKADSATRQTATKSMKANFSRFVAPYALGGTNSGGSDYVEDEAESSGGSSSPESGSGQEVVTVAQPEHEQISRRRANPNPHHQANHPRRNGGNRPNRIGSQRHDGRGGSGSRGRRSRRRRRRD